MSHGEPITLETLPDNPWDGTHHIVEVTQSSVDTFLRCPTKYFFRYMLRLRNRGLSIPLLIGKAVHNGLELLISPEYPRDQSIFLAMQAMDKVFDDVEEQSDLFATINPDKVEHARAVAHALLRSWWTFYGDEVEDWTLLASEFKVRPKEGVTRDSPLLERMGGMLDGLMQNLAGVWVVEHKTRSTLSDLNTLGLDLNFQCLWYLILCRHIVESMSEVPEPPKGFLFNAMMKPRHKLKDSADNPLQELIDRMMEAINKDPDKYFSMTTVLIPEAVTEHALRSFENMVARMDNLTADTCYQDYRSCDDFGGCPYRGLCKNGITPKSSMEEIADSPYVREFEIRALHEELEE